MVIRKTFLTSPSDISITHFQHERTYQNGDYHQHPIALSAPHLKRCFMWLLDVRHIWTKAGLHGDTILF
jgi:hypothetical protein